MRAWYDGDGAWAPLAVAEAADGYIDCAASGIICEAGGTGGMRVNENDA